MARKKADTIFQEDQELTVSPEEDGWNPVQDETPDVDESPFGSDDTAYMPFDEADQTNPFDEGPGIEAAESPEPLMDEYSAAEEAPLPPSDFGMEPGAGTEDSFNALSPDDNVLPEEDGGESVPAPSPGAAFPGTSGPRRDDRVLTIDARDEVVTEEEREAVRWHNIQSAFHTRRILTGTLDSIEQTESGLTLAVANYHGFRVVIPLKEMGMYTGELPSGREYAEMMQTLARRLNSRLGGEIDFIVKGYDNAARSVVASRREAMYKKRQSFYFDADALGRPLIYEGRVVQARVVAAAEKVIRVEVFGVECTIRASEMSWTWVGNAREQFHVGDRIAVRVRRIIRPSVEQLRIEADIRSTSRATNAENLRKCVLRGRYVGTVTDVRNGTTYIRLNNGANAISFDCRDPRTPGKKDDVSFVVTRLDRDKNVALGFITRIIRQNL